MLIDLGYPSFSAVDRPGLEQVLVGLRTRQGRGGPLKTTSAYTGALISLWRRSQAVAGALSFDPFPGLTSEEAAEASPLDSAGYPAVPDDVAIDVISKAITWLEDAHPRKVSVWSAIERVREAALAQGLLAATATVRASAAIPESERRPGPSPLKLLSHDLELTRAAALVTIAAFTGMRISEILSLQSDCIVRRTIGVAGIQQSFVSGRTFKGRASRYGAPAEWPVPPVVVEAIDRLLEINALRLDGTPDGLLFRNYAGRSTGQPLTDIGATRIINEFARRVGVVPHEGSSWWFTTHQFRRTFARFTARQNKSSLLALSEHFKHASVAITANSYVGLDYDLVELLKEETQAETARALESITGANALAGRMGDRIARSELFRGRAGTEVKKGYLDFLLTETDLSIHACEYGWCVFQPEVAKCGGISRPEPIGRSPGVCTTCTNFVVTGDNLNYWSARKARNEELLPRASPLTRVALEVAIAECDGVLNALTSTAQETA